MDKLKDKVIGMLLGVAIGDALGQPFEFKRGKIKGYTGQLSDVRHQRKDRYGHETICDYGQPSDDSEMMLVIARSLIEDRSYQKDTVLKGYLKWANHRTTFAMGTNTRALFKGVTTVKGYEKRATKMKEGNQSNGALMRCAPLALLSLEDVVEDCKLTNPDPVCVATNIFYICCLKSILREEVNPLSEAINVLEEAYEGEIPDAVLDTISQALDSEQDRDVSGKTKGWCLHPLYLVVHHLYRRTESFADAMEDVIMRGGDTDTNAAIVGGIIGCLLGAERLYQEQAENIELLISCDTSGGNKPRPEIYRPNDIIELGDALVEIFGDEHL